MRTVVRRCESPFAHPAEFLGVLWRDLLRSRALAVEIAKRDLRNQLRHSLLGPLGAVLFTLALTALALGFHGSGILKVHAAGMPYALYVLIGVVLWTTFIEILNAPIYGLSAELRLLARTSAPPEAVILGKLGPVFVNFAVKLVLVEVALAWYCVPVTHAAVLAGFGLLGLAVLATALGLLIAPLNLLYRDISWILGTMTTVWFFFSPVYYPAASTGAVGLVMSLNPVTPLLSDTRSLLLTGTPVTPMRSLATIAAACLLLIAAWLYARIVLSVAIEQVNE